MTLNRYSAALFAFALALVGAIVAIPAGSFDWKAGIQLGILGITTASTLGLPLVGVRWRASLKVLAAVFLTVLSALTPLIVGGEYNHVTIGLIVLSVLQVVSAQLGVAIRQDSAATFPPASDPVTINNYSGN